MPAVMVQGCTSWAGKSWLATALCRWFARQGLRVAPFKAQNMSNNARVVDGGEIGVAQWLQAHAAGVTPDVRMNPVLLKPETHPRSQVVRLGVVDRDLSLRPWRGRSALLWPTVQDALDELLAEFDLVVIEGAGSPAEINLTADDIVNMRVAAHAHAPVLLVADIDRGGAFAHLYGTWALVADEHRERIRGFVLNRFRGDPALLAPGPEQLEARTGVPTVGVVPLLDHDLPDEDGAALHRPGGADRPAVAVVRYPTASNLDEFTRLEQVAALRWATDPAHVAGCELVILPGSKHPPGDLAWLRARQLDRAVAAHVAGGGRLLGICGGLQLLGKALPDAAGGTVEGLGLLALHTTDAGAKRTVHTRARFADDLPDAWRTLAGRQVAGYEIRTGRTHAVDDTAIAALPEALGWADGRILAVYLHGLLEDDRLLTALFGQTPKQTLDDTFEALADAVDTHLDTALLRRLVGS